MEEPSSIIDVRLTQVLLIAVLHVVLIRVCGDRHIATLVVPYYHNISDL